MPGVSVRDLALILHVLFGSITVGATISYAFWLALAELEPDHLPFTIRAIRHSDRLVAIPAFLLTLATGLWLVVVSPFQIGELWLAVSLFVYAVVLVVGFALWGPLVRHELTALEGRGTHDPEYRRLRMRAQLMSFGTISALAMILALMVLKPT